MGDIGDAPVVDEMPRGKAIIYFDIDNCLYPKSKKVFELMQDLIDSYFQRNLSLSRREAEMLHKQYYKDYGLAIEGLARHHKVDALAYNHEVDDALPLDDILYPDPELRSLLMDVDKSKAKLWLFTNAYITHAKRVVRLLGIGDLFDGVTYCDYGAKQLLCKPDPRMFEKAEREAGASSMEDCYFVDDSYSNCRQAEDRGWTSIHLIEEGEPLPKHPACKYQIRSLQQLRDIFPQYFKHQKTEVYGYPREANGLRN